MIQFLLYALLAWFLYNLVFKFVIPIYRTTRQVKKKFREMSARMNQSDEQDQMQQRQGFDQKPTPQKQEGTPRKEDYIDFEEIK